MTDAKFIKRKKPKYKRAIILLIILIVILFLFYNIDTLLSGLLSQTFMLDAKPAFEATISTTALRMFWL